MSCYPGLIRPPPPPPPPLVLIWIRPQAADVCDKGALVVALSPFSRQNLLGGYTHIYIYTRSPVFK